jgi:A/G-specific adenine glycosylase
VAISGGRMELEQKIYVFQDMLMKWYSNNQRKFPWRYTYNPYYVLVSEVLLQQTNADKVIEPFNQITGMYKDIFQLSQADDDILKEIFKKIGLFYRAERLKGIASKMIEKHNGIIPSFREDLLSIKGIGDYAANAILCFGYNLPYAVLDVNVIRIIERLFGIKSDKKRPRTDKKLWQFAQSLLPDKKYVDYNYAILDFAASVCKARKGTCNSCLLSEVCLSYSGN